MPPINLVTGELLGAKVEQEEPFPILVLHGYEVHAGGRLSPLAQAVCEAATHLLTMNGDLRVIILGGWHLKEVGWRITIADAMKSDLISRGIDLSRLITKQNFQTLDCVMPPRDTWEELILLLQILGRIGISPKAPMQSIAWDFHIPRIQKMYKTYGFTNTEFVPATPTPYKELSQRKWRERMARIIRYFDPRGEGGICRETRLRRTLNGNLKPLIP